MRPVKYNYADSFWCTYIVSVFAASIAETVTYPLDLTKTRLQIQGEASSPTSINKKVFKQLNIFFAKLSPSTVQSPTNIYLD